LGVPGFFGPLLPLLPQPPAHAKANRRMASEDAKALLLPKSEFENLASKSTRVKTENRSEATRKKSKGGIRGVVMCGTISDGAVVVTLTAHGEADPLGVRVVGEAVQTAKAGAPVQVSATVPANPFSGEICRLYVAVLPAVTVAEVEPLVAAAIEKSVAVPTRATARGLPGALSVIVREPVRFPLTVGAKVTLKVQLVPGATLLPQLSDREKSPLSTTFVMMSVPSPVLFRVIPCEELVVPTC
jgi:hypothetical protein